MQINKTLLKHPAVIIGMIALGYWVLTRHPQHALELLPYSILLLCPLMHVFMHRHHKHDQPRCKADSFEEGAEPNQNNREENRS